LPWGRVHVSGSLQGLGVQNPDFKASVFASSNQLKRGSMTKYKLEYIWLDDYTPTPSVRARTQSKEFDKFPTLEQLPLWGFDCSSTNQAEGHSSDCVLKPVAVYPVGGRTHAAVDLLDDI